MSPSHGKETGGGNEEWDANGDSVQVMEKSLKRSVNYIELHTLVCSILTLNALANESAREMSAAESAPAT